jgi:hypothetical protein
VYSGIASLLSPRPWLLTEANSGTTNLIFPHTQSISIYYYLSNQHPVRMIGMRAQYKFENSSFQYLYIWLLQNSNLKFYQIIMTSSVAIILLVKFIKEKMLTVLFFEKSFLDMNHVNILYTFWKSREVIAVIPLLHSSQLRLSPYLHQTSSVLR